MSRQKAQPEIHPTAVVEPGAELASDVRVGPLSYVQAGASVGEGTVIGPQATVLEFVSVGRNCRVHAGAVLGDLPQDLAFPGEESYVRIGDGCVFREGVTVHRGTEPGSTTEIGEGCMLMSTSHVAHNCRVGDHVIMASGSALGGRVEIGERTFVGGGQMVHQFCRVGRLAMLSGNGAVKKDIPPFMITRELDTRVMGLNTVGLRRAGIPAQERKQLKRALKVLYRSGLNVSQAVERLEAELEGDCVAELVAFIRASQRGISPWYEG